jgi:hypothetical protein
MAIRRFRMAIHLFAPQTQGDGEQIFSQIQLTHH